MDNFYADLRDFMEQKDLEREPISISEYESLTTEIIDGIPVEKQRLVLSIARNLRHTLVDINEQYQNITIEDLEDALDIAKLSLIMSYAEVDGWAVK